MAELLTLNIPMPSAPFSESMVVSVVYHSIAVQVGFIGLHSTDADLPLPSQAVAVIVTLPSSKNVTLPVYGSTLAIDSSDEDHKTDVFITPFGPSSALRVCETPTI